MERKHYFLILGTVCLGLLVGSGVFALSGGQAEKFLVSKEAAPVSLTPLEEAQKDYAGVAITYQFGDQSETLDGGRIVSWLRTDANGQVTFDPQQVRAFVKELADKYDTAYTPRTFHTSGGQDITISEGDYGWRIDQEKETAHLLDLLAQKQSTVCEPVYAQTAAVHGHQDWGTT